MSLFLHGESLQFTFSPRPLQLVQCTVVVVVKRKLLQICIRNGSRLLYFTCLCDDSPSKYLSSAFKRHLRKESATHRYSMERGVGGEAAAFTLPGLCSYALKEMWGGEEGRGA